MRVDPNDMKYFWWSEEDSRFYSVRYKVGFIFAEQHNVCLFDKCVFLYNLYYALVQDSYSTRHRNHVSKKT